MTSRRVIRPSRKKGRPNARALDLAMTVLSRSKKAALWPTSGSVSVRVLSGTPLVTAQGDEFDFRVPAPGATGHPLEYFASRAPDTFTPRLLASGSGMLVVTLRLHSRPYPLNVPHDPRRLHPPVTAEWVRLDPPGAGPRRHPSPPDGARPLRSAPRP